MAIGIVDENDFMDEVSSLDIPKNIGTIIDINRGRGNVKEVPEVIREIVSETVIEGGDRKDVEESFGVSQSSISAYIKGAHSTASYHKPESNLTKNNNRVRNKIVRKSRGVLLRSLNKLLEDGSLNGVKPIELATIAKSMGSLSNDVAAAVQVNTDNRKVIVFAPRLKEEDDYQILDIHDNA